MYKKNPELKYRQLWLLVGYSLVAYVIYSSLTPNPIEVDINYFDKYAHTFAYFVLMGWFMQIFHLKKNIYICAVLFVTMGTSLEFFQGMTGYRTFDLNDMLANTAGVILALLLVKTPFPKILYYFESKIVSSI